MPMIVSTFISIVNLLSLKFFFFHDTQLLYSVQRLFIYMSSKLKLRSRKGREQDSKVLNYRDFRKNKKGYTAHIKFLDRLNSLFQKYILKISMLLPNIKIRSNMKPSLFSFRSYIQSKSVIDERNNCRIVRNQQLIACSIIIDPKIYISSVSITCNFRTIVETHIFSTLTGRYSRYSRWV